MKFIEVPEDGVCYYICPLCGAAIEEIKGKRFAEEAMSGCLFSDYRCLNGHLIESHGCGGQNKLKEV
jgi:hypothetical protein